MRRRTAAVSLAVVVGIVGVGFVAHPVEPPAAPGPTCSPTHVAPHEYRCTFPTHSELRATVYVQTFEDGSARTLAIDPDQKATD